MAGQKVKTVNITEIKRKAGQKVKTVNITEIKRMVGQNSKNNRKQKNGRSKQ